MKISTLGSIGLMALAAAACSDGGVEVAANVAESSEAIIGPSTPGGRNEVVMLYRIIVGEDGGLYESYCSGSYFAPRVVLTAAHCLEDIYSTQLFVYYGDDFAADYDELTPGGDLFVPPAPGTPSHFSQADSFEKHPSWDPNLYYPDMGVVYLDRKLPFDPLPLSRNAVAANRTATISGWGSNVAPTPTTGDGYGVQRTGTTRTLGSPTIADYHPEDPNPGMLNAAIRANVLKTDGRAPYANGCFGDSGGPLLINDFGQTYIAGVGYFTGLSCLDYNLFTRLNPFLPFLDNAYKKGGQETLIPSLDCVAPNAQGSLTAFFGYNNKNGVSVTVPYGTKNSLARDTNNWRPTRFLPGQHRFSFAVDFTSTQTASWTLSPDNSPTTTVNVNASSRRCGAAEAVQSSCGLACRASQRTSCEGLPTFETCMANCFAEHDFYVEYLPDCVDENAAVRACTAATLPTPASNWQCYPGYGAIAFPACEAAYAALDACFFENYE
jgi:hypothetical protein